MCLMVDKVRNCRTSVLFRCLLHCTLLTFEKKSAINQTNYLCHMLVEGRVGGGLKKSIGFSGSNTEAIWHIIC